MRQAYLSMILAAVMAVPVVALALERDVRVEWEYPYPENIAGFRLYQDDKPVCETTDPTATSMTCAIDLPDGSAQFTLVSFLADGTEGTPSLPVTHIFSSTLKAILAADKLDGESPLSVTFDASSSTGDIVLYEWSFGDGVTATGAVVDHTFPVAGIFTVTLRTTDTIGAIDTESVVITVTDPAALNQPPTAVISSSSTVGAAPLPVEFDGRGSSDSDGTIQFYDWDFGDGGVGSGPTRDYTYLIAGTFNARLTVIDNGGLDDSVSTPVLVSEPSGDGNQRPVAVISVSRKQGRLPLKVNFRGGASYDPDGEISSWSWNFGDGSSASGVNVSHTFTQPAEYKVTLKVTDNRGRVSQPARITVTVLGKGQKIEDLFEDAIMNPLAGVLHLLLQSSEKQEQEAQQQSE